tara:strand:+ start:201 stop:995 length:795 start_codon:yes stop_codon:yes gene_type:complete
MTSLEKTNPNKLALANSMILSKKSLLAFYIVSMVIILTVQHLMLGDIDGALTASVAYSSAYSFIEFLGMIIFVVFTMLAIRSDSHQVSLWQIMKSQVKGYFASAFVGLLFMLMAMSALTAVVGEVTVADIGTDVSFSSISGSSASMIVLAILAGVMALWVFWFVTIKSSMNYALENRSQEPSKGVINFCISTCRAMANIKTHLFVLGGIGVWIFFVSIQSLVRGSLINIPLTILMHIALSVVIAWYFLVLSEIKDTDAGEADAV